MRPEEPTTARSADDITPPAGPPPAPPQYPIPKQSAGHAPRRRPGSIRRTSSIDTGWPNGFRETSEMVGRARDLLTPLVGEPVTLAVGRFRIAASAQREIQSITVEPNHPGAQQMVGARAGGASRKTLAAAMGDLRGTPTYALLDDFSGASLVGIWFWIDWTGERPARPYPVVNICTGFTEGGGSLQPDGTARWQIQSSAEAPSLENPDDSASWHQMPAQQGPAARRARRLDIWREGGLIKVDAGFQDSGPNRAGGRTAVHEYRVLADIDEATGVLTALEAIPLVLPYAECPGAVRNTAVLIGRNVADFRETVAKTLLATLGCTHLNDVLRNLADVPALARRLPSG